LGLLLGIWSVATFYYLLKEPVINHVRELHMGKTQNPNLSLSRNMVVLFSTVGVLLLLGTCCYLISIVTIEYDPVWN
jgi:hypothetical protein